jgi:hypothetical protein
VVVLVREGVEVVLVREESADSYLSSIIVMNHYFYYLAYYWLYRRLN